MVKTSVLDITVCILSYNRATYLREAIISVLGQSDVPNRIVIFDNGSKGDVQKTVDEFTTQGVQFQGSSVTNSPIWNFKRAVAYAQTQYVFVMHDDDRINPDFLEKQVSFLENNPDIGAVTCNGFIIDEAGKRNGRYVRAEFVNAPPETYKCSVDVAIRYASDGCIPFSPTVYRSTLVKQVDFREEYGKFCDAVFFCDMADMGVIAFRSDVLYECRVHSGQDSIHSPIELVEKLENFFLTRKSETPKDILLLQRLLVKQHTLRILRQFLVLGNFFSTLKKLKDEMFSWKAVVELFKDKLKRKGIF
jgi:glycosyltransferase involved in cell wall biosynthesis